MAAKHVVYVLLLSAALCTPAAAQKANSSNATVTSTKHAGEWRSSKMIGLNVYNPQNEKIGDISEILIDQGGKVVGYVLGVGGFLGMGQHDVLVQPGQLKFVMEPLRTSNTGTGTTNNTAANRGNNATTGTSADNANARQARSANEQWYPDHAVMNATKDQLKGMPEFKFQ